MQPRSDAGRNHASRQRVIRLLIAWAFHVARSARHAVLSEISPFDGDGDVRIVIETPRGSRSKYSYDPECDCMQLSTVLPEGMVFPYDFGFVPSTLGGDVQYWLPDTTKLWIIYKLPSCRPTKERC